MNKMKGFVKPKKNLLTFVKNEDKTNKILIYGFDGTGKSQFAQTYCEDHNLKPVCFDFDKTNRSCPNIIKFQALETAEENAEYFIDIIGEIQESEFDTLVIDNITFFFELLLGKGRGMSKFSERSMRWKDIKQKILSSNLNIIFIGQIDVDIEYDKNSTEKTPPSKLMVNVHSLCNEKYFCEHDTENGYVQIIKKYREHGDWVGKTYEEIKSSQSTSNEVVSEPTKEVVNTEPAIKDVTPPINNDEEELSLEETVNNLCEVLKEQNKKVTTMNLLNLAKEYKFGDDVLKHIRTLKNEDLNKKLGE